MEIFKNVFATVESSPIGDDAKHAFIQALMEGNVAEMEVGIEAKLPRHLRHYNPDSARHSPIKPAIRKQIHTNALALQARLQEMAADGLINKTGTITSSQGRALASFYDKTEEHLKNLITLTTANETESFTQKQFIDACQHLEIIDRLLESRIKEGEQIPSTNPIYRLLSWGFEIIGSTWRPGSVPDDQQLINPLYIPQTRMEKFKRLAPSLAIAGAAVAVVTGLSVVLGFVTLPVIAISIIGVASLAILSGGVGGLLKKAKDILRFFIPNHKNEANTVENELKTIMLAAGPNQKNLNQVIEANLINIKNSYEQDHKAFEAAQTTYQKALLEFGLVQAEYHHAEQIFEQYELALLQINSTKQNNPNLDIKYTQAQNKFILAKEKYDDAVETLKEATNTFKLEEKQANNRGITPSDDFSQTASLTANLSQGDLASQRANPVATPNRPSFNNLRLSDVEDESPTASLTRTPVRHTISRPSSATATADRAVSPADTPKPNNHK